MTAPLLELVVPGRPVPKGRPRFGAGGRTYTPAATEAAEQTMGWRARSVWRGLPTRELLEVQVDLWIHGGSVGDVDNYAKLCLDALQGVVYVNDRQVRRLLVELHDTPGTDERTALVIRPYGGPVSTTVGRTSP